LQKVGRHRREKKNSSLWQFDKEAENVEDLDIEPAYQVFKAETVKEEEPELKRRLINRLATLKSS
jgi:hypothetical protein